MINQRNCVIVVAATLVAVVFGPGAARADHKCDPVTDPGWSVVPSHETTGESDSAPYQDGTSGNWFVDRTTTMLPFCNYFDAIGNYSLRSYSLSPRISKEPIGICRAGAGGASEAIAPYAGPCPPM
jgi:hypothetical protein